MWTDRAGAFARDRHTRRASCERPLDTSVLIADEQRAAYRQTAAGKPAIFARLAHRVSRSLHTLAHSDPVRTGGHGRWQMTRSTDVAPPIDGVVATASLTCPQSCSDAGPARTSRSRRSSRPRAAATPRHPRQEATSGSRRSELPEGAQTAPSGWRHLGRVSCRDQPPTRGAVTTCRSARRVRRGRQGVLTARLRSPSAVASSGANPRCTASLLLRGAGLGRRGRRPPAPNSTSRSVTRDASLPEHCGRPVATTQATSRQPRRVVSKPAKSLKATRRFAVTHR